MRKKNILCALLAAGLFLTSPTAAFAEPYGPGTSPEPEPYTEEELARLQDNALEYDEVQLRVREYNPAISQAWKTYKDTKRDYVNMVTELESQYDTVIDMADSYVDLGNMMGNPTLVATGKSLGKAYKTTLQGVRDTVNNWDNNRSATSQIRQFERQMTAGAQQALIGYDMIRKNMSTLETMVQLYQKQYDMYQRMQSLGMATDKDVLSAQTSLLSGQSQLASLNSQSDSLRRTLCLMLGYDPDSNPDIRPIPDFDRNRLNAMNLEEDTRMAIGNNYTLIGQRTSSKARTSSGVEIRLKGIEEGEQKLTIEMQRLYQEVMDKKAAYDAAATGFAAAEKTFGASTRQYQNGMLSEVQYVGTQIAYNQKKAAFESANLELWQAMENYDWGVMGLAAVE